MLSFKSCFRSLQIFTLTAIALSSAGQLALSQSLPDRENIQPTPIIFNDPTPPSQGSPSGRRRGGGSRGPCRQFEGLTALVPANNGKVWGQTTSDRPTFWFYLPNPLTAQTPIEFVVQDSADNYVYRSRYNAPETRSGLIGITIPANTKSLEAGKTYSWTLSVYCDPSNPSTSVFVNGTLQRVNLDAALQNRLQGATPVEQVNLYAANGIWFEAFNTLANLYRTRSGEQAIATAWASLLQQVNLESMTQTPFSSCCTPEQKTEN